LTSKKWALETGAPDFWINIANHCFAARGMRGEEDAMVSGAGHLLFSIGSDTLWSIDFFEEYYNADSDKEMIACSVGAFEHATATQRIEKFGSEVAAVRDAITNIYPKGILSYVADSRDYYKFISEGLVELKDDILARTEDELGLVKFVIRPDSSPKTPLEVICGDDEAEVGSPEWAGSLEILWNIFGGDTNAGGYRVINPKVGLIYGEAITLDMQTKIYAKMKEQGFCVSNVLFGVGSWAFLQDSSRDSYSFAIKGSSSIVDGEELSMQKTPKTAATSKTSARGLLRVEKEGDDFVLYDQQTPEQETKGELKTVFKDGKLVSETSLQEIRNRLWN
jgi:nicotinamide phosphoribosyltransferase